MNKLTQKQASEFFGNLSAKEKEMAISFYFKFVEENGHDKTVDTLIAIYRIYDEPLRVMRGAIMNHLFLEDTHAMISEFSDPEEFHDKAWRYKDVNKSGKRGYDLDLESKNEIKSKEGYPIALYEGISKMIPYTTSIWANEASKAGKVRLAMRSSSDIVQFFRAVGFSQCFNDSGYTYTAYSQSIKELKNIISSYMVGGFIMPKKLNVIFGHDPFWTIVNTIFGCDMYTHADKDVWVILDLIKEMYNKNRRDENKTLLINSFSSNVLGDSIYYYVNKPWDSEDYDSISQVVIKYSEIYSKYAALGIKLDDPDLEDVIKAVEIAESECCKDNFLPKIEVTNGNITMVRVEKGDLINLYMGSLTSCCQEIGGAGEDVCIEGWTRSDSSNYVFTTSRGKIIAHMWCILASDGSIIIDSVEGFESYSHEYASIATCIAMFVNQYTDSVYISKTKHGLTRDIRGLLTLSEEKFAPEYPEYSYVDHGKFVYQVM